MLLQKGFEFEPFHSQIPVNHPDSTELARRKWTVEYILYSLNFPGFTEFLKTGKSTSIFRSKKLYALSICKKGLTNFFLIGEESKEEGKRIPWPRTSPLFFLPTSLSLSRPHTCI